MRDPHMRRDPPQGLTRRDLLRGIAVAGLAGGVGATLGGCDDRPAAAYVPYDDGSGRTPKQGGRIRAASLVSSTADTLDPAKAGVSTDYLRHYMLYSGLTQFDRDLTPQPWLAEELATDDRVTWRIRLRRGVTFHDGRPLTAADVVFTLARHLKPETGSKVKPIASQFASIRATGPLEVTLTLAGANADLPSLLAASHFLIVPDGTSDFSRGIGCGPFRLKEFLPGVRTVVVRNENYWRNGRPYLDEVELIGIPDEMARVNALLSGDVHIINAVNPRSTRRIRESPAHTLQPTPSGLYTNLIMRQDMPVTSSEDFVLAMKHLVDRPTVQRALFRGYAKIANDHPIPPDHKYFLKDLPQRQYDPDRARWHLKRAGLVGVRLPMYASPAAEASVDIAAMLQHSADDVGLSLAVNRVPSDGYWSNHWMKHPLSFGNTNPRPTADLLFTMLFKSDAPWNESAWKNGKFDQLLVAARGEADEAKRKQLYGDMQEIVHSHCGVAIPCFIDFIDGFDRRLKGYGRLPLGGFMGYQFAEHVWWDA